MAGSAELPALESSTALQLPPSSDGSGIFPVEASRQTGGDSPAARPDGDPAALQETMLQIDINHQQLDETAFFLRAGDKLYASLEDLQKWRVLTDGAESLLYQGRRYFLLSSIPGVVFQLDERTQTVTLDAKPGQLALSVYKLEAKRDIQLAQGAGAFFNYDLSSVKYAGKTANSGFFELGVFSRFGVGTSGVLVQDKSGRPQSTRLMTTWTLDFPEDVSSLRIGDAYSQPGYWGRSVIFGGFQYASNFSTQPRLIRFPYLTAAGEAVVPSTVDVYINNTKVVQQNVPPGPFSFTDLPAVTGHGEMRMVVRDVLGREQVVTQPFYASDALLRVGLADYSCELGVVRSNYGISNNKYAHLLAAATYREGLTESLTGELRGELSRTHQAAGAGGSWQAGTLGMLVGSLAFSQSGKGAGSLLMAGFDRRTSDFSFGLHSQFASRSFVQTGLDVALSAPRLVSSINMSYASLDWGTVGMAYVLQDNRELGKSRVVSANYGLPLGKEATLHAIAYKNLAAGGNSVINAVITFPLGERTSASVSQKRSRTGGAMVNESFAQIQQNPPYGTGWGYHLEASSNKAQRGSVTLQTDFGSYNADTMNVAGNSITRLNAAGGVGYLGGRLYAMRPITGSFGVVKVGDYQNVRVYADNLLVGKTDADGYVLVPQMRPYGANEIGVEQKDLPLDAEVDALKLIASPYYRSGVLVDFPIRMSHGATLRVVGEDGKPVPSGALVRIVGSDKEFPVALEGEVYLTGLSEKNELDVSWQGQSCRISVPMPATDDPLPSLGSFTCKGIAP